MFYYVQTKHFFLPFVTYTWMFISNPRYRNHHKILLRYIKRHVSVTFVYAQIKICFWTTLKHNSVPSGTAPLFSLFLAVYFTTIPASRLCNVARQDHLWMTNWEGFRRKWWGSKRNTIPAFAYRCWGEPQETLVTIADVPVKIRTVHIWNKSLYRYGWANQLGFVCSLAGHKEYTRQYNVISWQLDDNKGVKERQLSVIHTQKWLVGFMA